MFSFLPLLITYTSAVLYSFPLVLIVVPLNIFGCVKNWKISHQNVDGSGMNAEINEAVDDKPNVTIKLKFFYARAFNGSFPKTNLNQDLFELYQFLLAAVHSHEIVMLEVVDRII